ncbi:hypothetical protein [Saccharothrix syringae]|uniref:Uncharacterized protein n=1 Tax=Saccharothrix syringae TaxID=103733 RepID=A0A5Q0H224_SACSY|nr:hypothetical protein [Saccharothrix syringae]QFZ19722.1 hypothetical protein EKG83_21840 [Saccharothrix syringae]
MTSVGTRPSAVARRRPWWDAAVSFAVAVCSLVHAMAPRETPWETPWLGPVLVGIGVWLAVAALAEPLPEAGDVAVGDAVTGAVVVLAGVGATARAVVRWRYAADR